MERYSTEQLNPRIKIVKHPAGKGYSTTHRGQGRLGVREMGNLIREGYEIEVFTEDGLDYTKEVLTKIALSDIVAPNISGEIIGALSEIIETEMLYLIIENGGIDNYLTRKARGAVNERL